MSGFEKLFQVNKLLTKNKEIFKDVTKICKDLQTTYTDELESLSKQEPNQNHFNDLFKGVRFDFSNGYAKKTNSTVTYKNPSGAEISLLDNACGGLSPDQIRSIQRAIGFYPGVGDQKVDWKPCIAAVGQTNAGKSSLINCILRQRIAPQNQTRLTSRVTMLTYSTPNFVAELQLSRLTKLSINEKLKKENVNLKLSDRNDANKVNVELRVGIENEILKDGFDVVDSPGLNENIAFNNACDKMTETFSPLLIYVIDGRMGLVEADVIDIRKLEMECIYPEFRIIYFVTKLDRSDQDKEMNEDENDIVVANRRLKNVFNKLQKEGFIDDKEKMESCRIFHGVSLWIVEDIQKGKAADNDVERFHMKNYIRFQQCLTILIKECIETPFKELTKRMQTTLESVIEKSRICACDIVEEVEKEKEEKREIIKEYESTEGKLYKREVDLMDTELKEKLREYIDENKDDGTDRSVIESILREYERVKEGNLDEYLNKWKEKIREAIDSKLTDDIKLLSVHFMANKEIDLRRNLKKIAEQLSKGRYNWPSFNMMLKNRLFYEYRVPDDSTEEIRKSSIDSKKLSRIFKNLRKLFKSCVSESREDRPENTRSSVKSWLENQYKLILTNFSQDEYLCDISKLIYEEFETRHKNFTNELNDLTEYLREERIAGLEERQTLQKVSNNFAIQYVRLLGITTSDVIPDVYERTFVNSGTQASIYKCDIARSLFSENTKCIAEKEYHQKKFDLSSLPGDLAMEIFYCSRLNGPTQSTKNNFLTMHGLKLKPAKPGKKFTLSIYFDYLDLGDCANFLANNIGKISKEQRLKLAIDVAKGLCHLHALKITHRDIKMENILIRLNSENEYEAVIADYGFSKSIGFLTNTRVGSPLYMAPELFNSGGNNPGQFNEKIDVYSFGIFLWSLMSYCFDEEDENCELAPKFVQELDPQKDFHTSVMEGSRPEHRKVIDPDIFLIMEDCWQADSNHRPSFNNQNGGILKRLELGLKTYQKD